ncbi:MAG: metal-sensitive transcriptional regulator [Chloroflexota bacterium]|nr:metal-sensitive transcriptional regulator [Chloroflexota bacterium]MDE3103301.1 metal-sensitive transcriptional regulator [Chloroflexota bacterium]
MVQQKSELAKRLASIEGHIRGVRTMVEQDVYCVDVLRQTYAVERALKKFEAELLRGHLSSCVPKGFTDGRNDQMIGELTELFEIAKR